MLRGRRGAQCSGMPNKRLTSKQVSGVARGFDKIVCSHSARIARDRAAVASRAGIINRCDRA